LESYARTGCLGCGPESDNGTSYRIKRSRKVFEITDKIGMTIAGSAGDGQALVRLLKAEVKLYEMQESKSP